MQRCFIFCPPCCNILSLSLSLSLSLLFVGAHACMSIYLCTHQFSMYLFALIRIQFTGRANFFSFLQLKKKSCFYMFLSLQAYLVQFLVLDLIYFEEKKKEKSTHHISNYYIIVIVLPN